MFIKHALACNTPLKRSLFKIVTPERFPAKERDKASATAAYQSGLAGSQEGPTHPVRQARLAGQGPQHAPALQCWEPESRHHCLQDYCFAAQQPDQNTGQLHWRLLGCPDAQGTLVHEQGGRRLRGCRQGCGEVRAGMEGQGADV